MSKLDAYTASMTRGMRQSARKEFAVRMAAIAWNEVGHGFAAAEVARYVHPHYRRVGIDCTFRAAQRYVALAREQRIAEVHPEDLERTRDVLAIEARQAARRAFALAHACMPKDRDAEVASPEEFGPLATRMKIATRLFRLGLEANTQVIKIYHLDGVRPLEELLTEPEQRTKALDLISRIAPMLAEEDRQQLFQQFAAVTASTERPGLSLVPDVEENA